MILNIIYLADSKNFSLTQKFMKVESLKKRFRKAR